MNAPAIRDDALDRIRAAMEDAGAGALVVTDPPSVRYLSGFTTPADGIVVVREEDAFLVTDTRYTAQADAESRIDVRFARPWHQEVAQLVEDRATAVEADAMTLSDANILAAALGRPLIETQGIVRGIRAVKSSAELEALREAARITDLAFNESLRWIRPGVREVDVAWRIEGFLRQHRATAGFEIVVASGVRSAMPHGVASDKLMEEGELVTLDFGARVRGYHADLTRTVAIGSPTDAAASLHEAVAEAQARALEAIRPGAHGRELDDLARRALEARGLAEAFAHSLGHGVGLQIHESPTLSRRSDDRLSAGMVVTVEPGAYFPGIHGVRIEDLVVVTDHGHEVLSRSDKGLIRIEPQAA